jgi:hypothetical protein
MDELLRIVLQSGLPLFMIAVTLKITVTINRGDGKHKKSK